MTEKLLENDQNTQENKLILRKTSKTNLKRNFRKKNFKNEYLLTNRFYQKILKWPIAAYQNEITTR